MARGTRLRLYGSSSCGLNATGADLDLSLETARPSSHAEQVSLATSIVGHPLLHMSVPHE